MIPIFLNNICMLLVVEPICPSFLIIIKLLQPGCDRRILALARRAWRRSGKRSLGRAGIHRRGGPYIIQGGMPYIEGGGGICICGYIPGPQLSPGRSC
jgi:hypothetical protein